MFLIDNESNTLSLTRGDTAYLSVVCSQPYDFEEGDKITLSVKKNIEDTQYALQVEANAINEALVFLPLDTKNLECGKYWYDIQINTVKGEVFTVVGPTRFYLLKEVNTND